MDTELVLRAQRRDEQAFASLCVACGDRLHAVAHRILRDVELAEDASSPIDATLGGYSGKRLDLHLPTDVDSCDEGRFRPWAGSIHAQGPDVLWHVWIIDVEGTRIIVVSNYSEGTSSADQAELQAVVDSIVFTP